MFAASGLVFLDPEFVTELIKPLVDHRLAAADHTLRIRSEMSAYITVVPELQPVENARRGGGAARRYTHTARRPLLAPGQEASKNCT